MTSHL